LPCSSVTSSSSPSGEPVRLSNNFMEALSQGVVELDHNLRLDCTKGTPALAIELHARCYGSTPTNPSPTALPLPLRCSNRARPGSPGIQASRRRRAPPG